MAYADILVVALGRADNGVASQPNATEAHTLAGRGDLAAVDA